MQEDLSRILSEHPFVNGLDPDQVKFLTGCAANSKFLPGEYLFREGGAAKLLYLVRDGEVAVQVYSPGQGATSLSTVGSGEIVGWSWVVEPYVAHFDVVAQTVTRAISIDAECLRNKCQNDPLLGYQMLARMVKVMEQRLQSTRLQLLDVYGRSH